jgi:ferredoxin-NADP reductase
MNNSIVKVLKADFVTHNVKRFVVEKPVGYTFVPGQATDLAINKGELTNELRPFTFTSRPDADHLEFIIKIYTGHEGMTEKLLKVEAGDELLVHEVFGTIHYQGPGLFIAGGAGITPFISIFRQLKNENIQAENTLLFANKTEADIILKDELKQMLGDNYHDVLEVSASGGPGRRVDRELLRQYVRPDMLHYYVCGPEKFTQSVVENLAALGIPKSKIILEQ